MWVCGWESRGALKIVFRVPNQWQMQTFFLLHAALVPNQRLMHSAVLIYAPYCGLIITSVGEGVQRIVGEVGEGWQSLVGMQIRQDA